MVGFGDVTFKNANVSKRFGKVKRKSDRERELKLKIHFLWLMRLSEEG